MEQQNQQPNQQLNQASIHEQKRQKSKRISIAILALAAVFLVVGMVVVWLGAYSDLFDTRGTIEGRLYSCVKSEECVLVKDGSCGTVIAVNKSKKLEWQRENTRLIEIINQICSPPLPEYLDVANFEAVCRQSRCAAQFIGKAVQEEVNTTNWQTYRNDEFGFEFKYPSGWSVNNDEARYPESNESYPRFTVTEPGLIKDSKCYAAIIFKDSKNPEKSTYGLYSEVNQKQNCQQRLDQILSTFRFVEPPAQAQAVHTIITEADTGTRIVIPRGSDVRLRLSKGYVWTPPEVGGGAIRLTRVAYLVDPGFSEWQVDWLAEGEPTLRSVGSPNCTAGSTCPDAPFTFEVTLSFLQ